MWKMDTWNLTFWLVTLPETNSNSTWKKAQTTQKERIVFPTVRGELLPSLKQT